MTTSPSTLIAGVLFAVMATLAWALNFIAPYVTGPYSIYDLMVIRYLIAGALGVLGVMLCRAQMRSLRFSQQVLAAGLGVIGYLGYGSCIAAGVIFAGPVLAAAFVGLVPVLLALLGNAKEKTVQWRRLGFPLLFIVLGLVLSNISSVALPHADSASWLAGVFFSVLAVALWLTFSLLNQRAMGKIAPAATRAWTGLMMAGAGIATLCVLPLLHSLGLLELTSASFGFTTAARFYAWGLVLAVVSSVIGAWAWNAATRRLPMVLSGQLISLESLFAALLGLLFNARLPTFIETSGLIAVIIGAGLAVHSILTQEHSNGCTYPNAQSDN